jgi:hypothetical protein
MSQEPEGKSAGTPAKGRPIDELKRRGAGRPAPESVASLYRQAFADFGVQSLWSRRPSDRPTIAQALVVAESLRRDGSMKTRALAARLEEACRAAL